MQFFLAAFPCQNIQNTYQDIISYDTRARNREDCFYLKYYTYATYGRTTDVLKFKLRCVISIG
jgi:hypothetical protein